MFIYLFYWGITITFVDAVSIYHLVKDPVSLTILSSIAGGIGGALSSSEVPFIQIKSLVLFRDLCPYAIQQLSLVVYRMLHVRIFQTTTYANSLPYYHTQSPPPVLYSLPLPTWPSILCLPTTRSPSQIQILCAPDQSGEVRG